MATVDLDPLLGDSRWLTDLARRLVDDAEDAADIVQETLHVASQHGPRTGSTARAWLRSIVRNRALDVLRARRSRRAAYLRARPAGAAAATVDVVAKAEVHERLVRTVRELPEPYRTTVLLRFFEHLPPREIAARLGVPVPTVHSRLQRGLARLREALRRACGDEWPLTLAPLVGTTWSTSSLLAVSLMKILLTSCLVIAAVAVAAFLYQGEEVTAPVEAVGATSDSGADVDPAGPADPAARVDDRTAVAIGPVSADSSLADGGAATDPNRRGRVIDVHGTGIQGVALSSGLAASGAGGAFEFPATLATDRIRSTDQRWATVLAGSARVATANVSTVVVAPSLELAGRVTDPDGSPLPGAGVAVHLPSHLGADLGVALDYSITEVWQVRCDADGRFVLRDVPAVAGGSLVAELGGYLPTIVPLPGASTSLLELELERPGPGATLVGGIVVDAFGAAVAGARVSAGRAVSRTDDRGEFTVDLAADGGRHLGRIVAVAPGMQPATFEPPVGAGGQTAWPERIVMRLGAAPLTIAGRVVDGVGRPVEGARVWIGDPLVIGSEGDVLLAESVVARREPGFWAFVTTDTGGRFVIPGLGNRAYEVRALDPRTLVAAALPAVPAGTTDCTLTLDGAVHEELRGRVVARDGTAIAGVSVTLQRPALEVRVPGGTRDEWFPRSPTTTGPDGSFRFENVPQTGVEVFAIGDPIQFKGRMVEPGCDPTDFVLEVDRRVHLQIELAEPRDRADRVRVLGTDGRPMRLRIMRGQSSHTNSSATIVDGRTEVLSLGEGAASAVFLRDGEEVGRMPLTLRIGSLNTVVF